MSEFLPESLRQELKVAHVRRLRSQSRLRVQDADGNVLVPILRLWATGFAVEKDSAPQLRGLVDIYDGGRHLYQCLIVATAEEGEEMVFEFKRSTQASDRAPLDFYRDEHAPIALLGR